MLCLVIWYYILVVNLDGKPMIVIPQKPKPFSPEEISSIVLKKLKDVAEDYLGKVMFQTIMVKDMYILNNLVTIWSTSTIVITYCSL